MLSSSLFLPYLLIALVVTAVAARRARTPARRRWFTVGLLVFFWAFAHIDDLLGGIQHKWLCHKEAGFFVYKTAKLPPELYDAAGKPKFMTEQGPDKKMLEPYIVFDSQVVREYRHLFLKIDKHIHRIFGRETSDLFAENVTFSAKPSAFIPTISHIGANRCSEITDEVNQWRKWEADVFNLR